MKFGDHYINYKKILEFEKDLDKKIITIHMEFHHVIEYEYDSIKDLESDYNYLINTLKWLSW